MKWNFLLSYGPYKTIFKSTRAYYMSGVGRPFGDREHNRRDRNLAKWRLRLLQF